MVMPKQLNANTGVTIYVLDRLITNGVIQFQNKYPGVNPETFKSDIHKYTARDLPTKYRVNLNSPIIELYNAKNHKKLHKTKADRGFEEDGLVSMTKKDVKHYSNLTEEAMKKQISYANITNGFEVTLSIPIPAPRLEDHNEWLKGRDKGSPFLGFADAYHSDTVSSFDVKPSSSFIDTPIAVNFRCIVTYKKISNDIIDLDI